MIVFSNKFLLAFCRNICYNLTRRQALKIKDWKKGALEMITKAFVPRRRKSSLLGKYRYTKKLLRVPRSGSRSSILGMTKYSRSCGDHKNGKEDEIYLDT